MGRLWKRCKDSSGCQPIDEFCDPAVDRCSPCAVRCYYATENDKECSDSCPKYYEHHILGQTQIQTATTNEDTTMNPVESTSQQQTWGGELFKGDPKRSTGQYEGWELDPAFIISCLVFLGLLVIMVFLLYRHITKQRHINQLQKNRSEDPEDKQGQASQSSSTGNVSTVNQQDPLLEDTNHQHSQQTASPPQAADNGTCSAVNTYTNLDSFKGSVLDLKDDSEMRNNQRPEPEVDSKLVREPEKLTNNFDSKETRSSLLSYAQ